MPTTYSPHAHVLLSSQAKRLDPLSLDAQAVIAERVLGLRGRVLDAAGTAEAKGYIALQVSLQVELGATGDVVAESKGSQSFTYAQVDGQRIAVHPLARRGVDDLLAQVTPPISTSENAVIVW